MTKKNRKMSIPLDLDNCQTLEHLQPIPKSRSSSITSIETSDSDGSVKMKKMLIPPPIREFDELTSFESFIRDETWDNEFDYYHAHLSYYPPFIMKECHDNLDKIKPTMNKNSRKFRRQLQHHVKNHLLKDLERCCGYELNMEKIDTIETPDKIVWKFNDTSDHGFSKEEEDLYDRHWKLELEISCNNENPLVDVHYKSLPLIE
ncbi:respiratory growth induced protein 1 [Suhomyces tanzawaensis NRRL Y-17324]|uniref:Respiratory growth induced protein 1 n=1 Tax=Suhomyces tanzawaensis NRRL Y-17324 TaxID=984487 RepID=A0A1E4SNR9_9ASCO|nr:respiratory growth induced protein 1 [Suhomyces tanzawaensis NRRL Y-17324]ODV81159.1 respiratory growth induced protein 1 [Suhomyces tanzawaensis NRRL Y-17324]